MPNLQDLEIIKKSAVVFIIFGATGDLSKRRIFPALYKLYKNNLLPEKFKIIACARTKHTAKSFSKSLEFKNSNQNLEDFFRKIEYLSLDVVKDINLDQVQKKIGSFENQIKVCPQRIFYMAISPTIFKKAIENIGKNRLNTACPKHHLKPRIIIEKPFGRDLKTAQSINSSLSKYFGQDQIYRIDHYMGKETVQNIFAFRFANEIFEPLWNNKYIDHVQITTAEHLGVEKRGEFYDQTGALRDIVQNHLLQLMSLVTMDQPENFDAKSVNDKKLEVIKSIKRFPPEEVVKSTVRGQYEGYKNEEKISKNSKVETYAMVKLQINNSRWQGVPFYLRTGKKLPGKVTSIIIQFKDTTHKLFENLQDNIKNHITIQIQPNAGIGIRLAAKKPGLDTTLEPVDMEFCYKTSFESPQPDAYERLLLDVVLGDQSLFMDQKIIEESWRVIDKIEKVWARGKPPLATYKPGSWGPKETDELIKKDGRQWLQPLLTICKI